MSHSNLVLAYHGCDITVRDSIIAGLDTLKSSANKYDWLGPGIYFYEGDPERALIHAQAVADHPERHLAAKPVVTPAVIGVALDVSRWLDMSTAMAIQEFSIAAVTCREGRKSKGQEPLKNEPAFEGDADNLHRAFDMAAFVLLHGLREIARTEAIARFDFESAAELREYQAVRSAFSQGDRVSEHSEFRSKNHIQIALRDPSCIRGYFIPVGHPPVQGRDAREASVAALEQAKVNASASKPRERAKTA